MGNFMSYSCSERLKSNSINVSWPEFTYISTYVRRQKGGLFSKVCTVEKLFNQIQPYELYL